MFTTIYICLLLVLVFVSWIASIYGVVLSNGEVMPSLLSADSLRWFVRHSMEIIAAAPLAHVLLILLMVGTVRSCGLLRYVVHLMREHKALPLVHRQKHALRIALLVFGVFVALVLSGILTPDGNLLSVTGHIVGGPLSRGWLFLLCLVVCVPCLIYSRLSDLWHTEYELLGFLTSEIARCSGYFVTLVVAALFMAALHYIGLFELLGWSDSAISIFSLMLYGLPLAVAVCKKGLS